MSSRRSSVNSRASSQDRIASNTSELEPIAPLVSIVSSIFVPLEQSVLEPIDEPRDRVARLELILKRIDSYSDGVKRNLMYMFTREKDRLQRMSADAAPPADSTMSQSEYEMLLHNVRTPPLANEDYTVPRPLIQKDQDERWAMSQQDVSIEELMKTVAGAVQQIDGFDGLVEQIKQEYRQAIEKEKAAEAAEAQMQRQQT